MSAVTEASQDELEIVWPPFRVPGPDTQALVDFLSDQPIGELVSYEMIARHLGVEPGAKAWRSNLASARRILRREGIKREGIEFGTVTGKGIEFGTVIGKGIVRLDDQRLSLAVQHDVRLHRGRLRRSLKKASNVDLDKLPQQQKTGYLTALSQMSVMFEFSSSSSRKKLEKATTVTQRMLPIAKTIEAFQDKGEIE